MMMTILLLLSLGQLEPATSAFENGDFEACVHAIDSVERAHGPTPRSASLRALALNELGRHLEAYRSLKVYFRLVEGRSLSGNTAHESLVELAASLESRLREERSRRQRELEQEGAEEASSAAGTEERLAAAEEQKRQAAFEQRVKELQRKNAIEDAIEVRRAHDGK